MGELIKRSEDWLDYHKGAPWETDAMKLIAELVKRVKELEQQLQQAHRAGWEQAKGEAVKAVKPEVYPNNKYIVNTIFQCADAIASMEYKEGKAND